jgi:hypothetical protein
VGVPSAYYNAFLVREHAEESQLELVLLISQGVMNIMNTERNHPHTLELGAYDPRRVIDTQLHLSWGIQQDNHAQLLQLIHNYGFY